MPSSECAIVFFFFFTHVGLEAFYHIHTFTNDSPISYQPRLLFFSIFLSVSVFALYTKLSPHDPLLVDSFPPPDLCHTS